MEFPERFTLSGVVMNVFTAPEGKNREGQAYGGQTKLQLSSAERLRNGELKLATTDLDMGRLEPHAVERFKKLVGRTVQVAVNLFVIEGKLNVGLAGGGEVREIVPKS